MRARLYRIQRKRRSLPHKRERERGGGSLDLFLLFLLSLLLTTVLDLSFFNKNAIFTKYVPPTGIGPLKFR
jgi:hypothetical protein